MRSSRPTVDPAPEVVAEAEVPAGEEVDVVEAVARDAAGLRASTEPRVHEAGAVAELPSRSNRMGVAEAAAGLVSMGVSRRGEVLVEGVEQEQGGEEAVADQQCAANRET